jgi:UvrD-like helicase C-terminal domain
MRWAMAMDDPFTPFEADFKAQRTPLFNNYRSSPELVRIQDVLAKALDAKATKLASKVEGTISGSVCAVWDFSAPTIEADNLAAFVSKQMAEHKLLPRDFSVLVRQKAGDYTKLLEPAFAKHGLSLRNEALPLGSVALQELLAEDLSEYLVALLCLFTNHRAGRHWTSSLDMMCDLRGLATDDDAGRAQVVKDLNAYSTEFRRRYPKPVAKRAEAVVLVRSLVDFLGKANILAASPAYRQGDWFQKVAAAAALHIEASCRSAKTWAEALDLYEGLHAVPLMTIHKSKGLEYHTVIFVGLDDDAWWSFDNDQQEATAGFFVAFSCETTSCFLVLCGAR